MSPPAPESGGWFWIDNQVVERIGDIGQLAATVYVVLARFAGDKRTCFPSITSIGRIVGATHRGVQVAIKKLETAGLIQVERSKGGRGREATNRYLLLPLSPPSKGEPGFTLERVRVNLDSPLGVNQEHYEEDLKEQDKRRCAKKASFDPLGLDLPYRSERFLQSWGGFVEHRQSGKHPLTARSAELILAKCRAWGEATAVEAIDTAVENGWQGIFLPKSNGHSGNGHPKPDERPIIYAN